MPHAGLTSEQTLLFDLAQWQHWTTGHLQTRGLGATGSVTARPAIDASSLFTMRFGLPTDVLPVTLVPDGHTIHWESTDSSPANGQRLRPTVYHPSSHHAAV